MKNIENQIKVAKKEFKKHMRKELKKDSERRRTTLVRISENYHRYLKKEARARRMCIVQLLDDIVGNYMVENFIM